MSFKLNNQPKYTYLNPRYHKQKCHTIVTNSSGILVQCENKKRRNTGYCTLHDADGTDYQFGPGHGRGVSINPFDTKQCCVYIPVTENNRTTYIQCKHAHIPQEPTCGIHSRYNTYMTPEVAGYAIIYSDDTLHSCLLASQHSNTSQIHHDVSELSVDTVRLIDSLFTLVDEQNTLISEAISQYKSNPKNISNTGDISAIYQLLLC